MEVLDGIAPAKLQEADESIKGLINLDISTGSQSIAPDKNAANVAYRVTGIPIDYKQKQVKALLQTALQLDKAGNSVKLRSIAISPNRKTKVTTVCFNCRPTLLPPRANEEWHFPIPTESNSGNSSAGDDDDIIPQEQIITIDSHFKGITVLRSFSKLDEHKIDIIAISGLGGHAFGSFKARDGQHMWLCDSLPRGLPGAQIMIYGYDTQLHGSTSFQDLESLASSLRASIAAQRTPGPINPKPRTVPLVFVAHSLGGLIVKEVIIQIKNDKKHQDLLESIYGALFFGVPSQGMEIASLVPMVAGQPNQALLHTLGKESQLLRNQSRDFPKAFDSKDSEIFCYYETEMSRTAKLTENNVWKMGGPLCILVDSFSARHTRPWENEAHNCIGMKRDHSALVKFSPNDSDYDEVIAKLNRMALTAVSTIHRGISGQLKLKQLTENEKKLQHLDLLNNLMPDTTVFGNQFLLHGAIKKGDILAARKLLAMGAKIDKETAPFESYLSLAVSSGKVEVVELLLDHGADIDKRRSYSMETPLMEATKSRSYSIVKLLLQRGADSQLTDQSGKSSLHIACECGDEGLVELLLQNGSGIEQRCSNSMDTPLLLATRSGKCAVIDLLIQRGALIEATDRNGKTPLHLVSELWGDDKIAKLLLGAGSNPNAKESSSQRTPLHYAAEKGNLAVVKDLLQSKAHANAQDGENGTTALHIAAELGHADIVSLLISKGASVSICLRVSRITPLHLASSNGHDVVVKILMEAGANAEATQYPIMEGKTPLHLAAQNGHHLVVRLLCLRGIIEKKEIGSGNTALLLAALRGHTLAAKALLEKNAEIEATNNEGSTALYLALKGSNEDLALMLLNEGASTQWPAIPISPLQYAAYVGQISVVRKLLEQGVDIQDTGEHGESALICAASVGHVAIVSLLLLNKARLNSQNATGCTALHQASRNGHGDIVHLLLAKEADFNLCDNTGKTPLHDAASQGHKDVVVLLINKGASCTATNTNLVTPLHLAAMYGHDNIMLLLIKGGAVVDTLDSSNLTPLVYACNNGHESTARALLREGAQVAGSPLAAAAAGNQLGIIDILQSHRNGNGAIGERGALFAAAYHGHALAIKKLLRWEGLGINAVGPEGISALHYAATNGHDSAIQALLEAGADVDHRSGMDWLPIHGAALNGHSSAIRMLLDAGSSVECLQDIFTEDLSNLRRSNQEGLIRLFVQFARTTKRFYSTIRDGDIKSVSKQATNTATVHMRDGNGHTALHVAIEYNCTEAIPILCDIGIGVDTKNYLGRTALHGAIIKGNIEAQRLLVGYRSDIDVKDLLGFTALHIAVANEQEVSVKILMDAGADISIKENMTQMNPYQYAEAHGFKAALPLLGKHLEEHGK